VDDRIIEALLKEADKDGDGEIGFVELKMCMA
jgi:Ca2+-binding EF-hand superfamily protein